jgi:hypothetical protein
MQPRIDQHLRLDSREVDAFIPSSMRRRSASEREGLSGCCAAQVSAAAIISTGRRKEICGSCPVAGRPRLFCGTFFLDTAILFVPR